MKGWRVNYSSLVVSSCFNNNLIILYKKERLKISYLWISCSAGIVKISGKVRGLSRTGKNAESLAHVWGKFPPALCWMYKSNTSPHISLLNVLCCLDSGKCFLCGWRVGVAVQLSVGVVSWRKRLWGWEWRGAAPLALPPWCWKPGFVGSKGALRFRSFLLKKGCELKFTKYNSSTFPTGLWCLCQHKGSSDQIKGEQQMPFSPREF